MEIKQMLENSKSLDSLIKFKIRQLEQLKRDLGNIKAVCYDSGVTGGGFAKDANFTKMISKIFDLEEVILKDYRKLLEVKQQIYSYIENIENTEDRLLLSYRYIDKLSWSKVADNLHMDKRQVFRRYKKIINKK